MVEIKCLSDIQQVWSSVPDTMVSCIESDLQAIKDWTDEDKICTLDNFYATDFGSGYIVLLDGTESREQLASIGLLDGYEDLVPEVVDVVRFGNVLWVRFEVVYTENDAMIFWIKKESIKDPNLIRALKGVI